MFHVARFLVMIFMAAVVIGAGSALFAGDFSVPHAFEDGEIISADVFNELFAYIENATNTVTSSDLVGTWSCLNFVANGSLVRTGDILDPQGLFAYKTVSITFYNDGDGTYSWSSTDYNPFNRLEGKHVGSERGNYEVFNNILFLDYFDHSDWGITAVVINKISPTRLFLSNSIHGSGTAMFWMVCDNQEIPPAKPTQLKAVSNGFVVTLRWQDNSDNELGFKIFRKDEITKQWIEIATSPYNITTYEDIVARSGKYWYRVWATNSYGDSDGSNVAKETVK